MTRLLSALLCVAAVGVATRARAGGLSFPEPSAAAIGRAGTAAAIPDGPSAVYYNPAGIALSRGLSIDAGVAVENDHTTVTPAGGAAYRTITTSTVPSLFVSQRIGDHLAIGFGFFRAPSQALEYPASFPDRFHVLRASFGGTELSPVVAGRPFSWLSIGFGLRVIFGDLDLAQSVGDPRYETQLSIRSKAIGVGGTAGVWARLYRQYLTLGLVYKSAVDLDHTGPAVTSAPGSDTPLSAQDALLTLPMPHVFIASLGSQPSKHTSILVEARVAFLRDFDGYTATDTTSAMNDLLKIPLALRELIQLRAGVERHLAHDRLALRLGAGYDLGAARRDLDPALPDGDRVVVSGGLGYRRPELSLDAGYMASFSPGSTASRGIAYPATYANLRHLVGLSLVVRIEAVGPRPQHFD